MSTQLIDVAGLRAPLAEICAGQEEHLRFFSGVFSALDTLASELSRRQEMWVSERKLSMEAIQRQAALEAAEAHGDRLAQTTDELSNARAELAQARQEIERLRGDLDKASSPAVADEELQEKLQRAEQERAQFDQERVVLETELDTVRHRAAEMSETLADQRREMGAERQQWAQELKQMRSLLETLSKRPAAPGPRHSAVDVEVAAPAMLVRTPATAPAAGDPVLDSVVAQFEMLQKDIVRRRKATAGCN